jgi:hypothetical protein
LFSDGKGKKKSRMKQENRQKNDENTADLWISGKNPAILSQIMRIFAGV